jgi:excinuclease UvrABC nuclease subunit
MSKWKDVKQLKNEKGIEDKPGIYMLYDEKSNTFYAGKAIRPKDIMIHI